MKSKWARHTIWCLILAVFATGCSITRKSGAVDSGHVRLTIVQVNDVYEINPLWQGRYGGMARVASVKQEELKENPNTLLVMAGDFLSPSVYNSLIFDGQRIRGRQMIDAMNAARFDIAVFGNHEFDIKETELQARLNESSFEWISSNSFENRDGKTLPFTKTVNGKHDTIPAYRILKIKGIDGTIATVGFMGIDITSNVSGYVRYSDPVETAVSVYNRIKDSCDIVIPITHQTIREDSILARRLPDVPIIIGGHEHDMHLKKVGNVYITKAHSNARSAFIISIDINKAAKTFSVRPHLKMLDSTVALDSSTSVVVNKWTAVASRSYQLSGFEPSRVIMHSGDSLEGRDVQTRAGYTNLSLLMVKGMAAACPLADVSFMNAGSIRLDDVLYPPVSEYDILRSLPFGGSVREVEMKGSLLREIIAAGEKNRGTGGFLLFNPSLQQVDTAKTYRVALTGYLLSGAEVNLAFLNEKNPSILKVYPEQTSADDPRSDIRLAVIRYIRNGGRP